MLTDSPLFNTRLLINGEWCVSSEGSAFAVKNPATGALIGHVADASPADTAKAISAASQAQPSWVSKSALERSALLRRWFELLKEHEEPLAQLLTLEQGKPITESRNEIAYGASYVEWFAEEAKRIYGDIIALPEPDRRILVTKEPVGVVAAITPWNFPNAMLARKLAPALAAGCTVVAKPAAETPFSALALGYLALQAGIPAGVINILPSTRAKEIGEAFTAHPQVRKISFTGSTAVGKQLITQSASTVKRITLELGGNAPIIVFDDADLDAAVTGAMLSKFRNAGQTCVCANRFYVQDGIYDRFAEKLARSMAGLAIGNGLDDGVTLGPLISQRALEKVDALVSDAVSRGARIQFQAPLSPSLSVGHYYPPTMLIDVPADVRLSCEEIFGPVAALIRFSSEEQVIRYANDSEYGLAAYAYTTSASRIKRLSDQLQTGMLGINTGVIQTLWRRSEESNSPVMGVRARAMGWMIT